MQLTYFRAPSFFWSLSTTLLFMQLSEETPRIAVTKPSAWSFYITYLLIKYDLQPGGADQHQCKTQQSSTA